MWGSFTFQGVDIRTFDLTYVPEASKIYVYDKPPTTINSRSFDGHKGGYYFGASTQPKVFNLRCYFEFYDYDETILERYSVGETGEDKYRQIRKTMHPTINNTGFLSKINSFFSIGKEGRLVFESRPYIYYDVVVTGVDSSMIATHKYGYVTISFTAFYPFGRMNEKHYDKQLFDETYGTTASDNALKNTGLLNIKDTYQINYVYIKGEYGEKVYLSPTLDGLFRNDFVKVYDQRFVGKIRYKDRILLHSAGNEQCPLSIRIKPNQNLKIKNMTNGSYCSLTNIDKYKENYDGIYIMIDGINGNVYFDGYDSQNAFFFHDAGFIMLEPSMPIKRNIRIKYGRDTVMSQDEPFNETDIGKFIKIGNNWHKITGLLNNRESNQVVATIDPSTDLSPLQESDNEMVNIVTMNEIAFEMEDESKDAYLDIDFIYQHTFS